MIVSVVFGKLNFGSIYMIGHFYDKINIRCESYSVCLLENISCVRVHWLIC